MKILVLTSKPRTPDNFLLWEGLRKFATVKIDYIAIEEQKLLNKTLSRYDFNDYDRVIIDLLFKYIYKNANLFSKISGLIFYDEDSCQEFIEKSKWCGRFSRFYKKLPHARLITTGHQVTEKFKRIGIDAHFLPKGYDGSSIYDMNSVRDIELGFIGRTNSVVYTERQNLLFNVKRQLGLEILRTNPGDDYRNCLNRIKIFLSADIGLGEYMAKNFEAMACGCLLMAYKQGNGEESALGLIDQYNVILYENLNDLCEKYIALKKSPEKIKKISSNGKLFAEKYFNYSNLSSRLLSILLIDTNSICNKENIIKRFFSQF